MPPESVGRFVPDAVERLKRIRIDDYSEAQLVADVVKPILEGLGYGPHLASRISYEECIGRNPREFPDVVLRVGSKIVAAVECKRPSMKLDASSLQQLRGYLVTACVDVGMLCNGHETLVCKLSGGVISVTASYTRSDLATQPGWSSLCEDMCPRVLLGLTSPRGFLDQWKVGPWHMTPLHFDAAGVAMGSSETALQVIDSVLGSEDLVEETCAAAVATARAFPGEPHRPHMRDTIARVYREARHEATRTTIWQGLHRGASWQGVSVDMLEDVPSCPITLVSYIACAGFLMGARVVGALSVERIDKVIQSVSRSVSGSARWYMESALRGETFPMPGETLTALEGSGVPQDRRDELWSASMSCILEVLDHSKAEHGVARSCLEVVRGMMDVTDASYLQAVVRKLPLKQRVQAEHWMTKVSLSSLDLEGLEF